MPKSNSIPQVFENYSLRAYNTFGIDVNARYFTVISSLEAYVALIKSGLYGHVPHLFLGGGSNILCTGPIDALVVKNEIKGFEVIQEDADYVILRSGAGEIWDDLVHHAVLHNWSGIENLALIPGTVGAAPMQNIGAYGVEIKDTFDHLEALNLETLQVERFEKSQCQFGYRESYFKQEGRGKYLISTVCFRLSKKPQIKTSYGAIQAVLNAKGIDKPTISDISKVVIEIRKSKLPDPKEIGNSGSFFKNPTVSAEEAVRLKNAYSEIPNYPVEGSQDIKFPAGWFIEQAGWKGYRDGDAGVHVNQALVLVNYGHANGKQIQHLSEKIKASVFEKYGISLETEVNLFGPK
jgi:UDP-N-acetylmuramate dehydrogenase